MVLADSQFIIDHLAKTYDKDLSKELSDRERAIERAFLKMTEESLSWSAFTASKLVNTFVLTFQFDSISRCMTLHRFVYEPNSAESGINKAFLLLGKRKIVSRSKAQGYGLHTKEEGNKSHGLIG